MYDVYVLTGTGPFNRAWLATPLRNIDRTSPNGHQLPVFPQTPPYSVLKY